MFGPERISWCRSARHDLTLIPPPSHTIITKPRNCNPVNLSLFYNLARPPDGGQSDAGSTPMLDSNAPRSTLECPTPDARLERSMLDSRCCRHCNPSPVLSTVDSRTLARSRCLTRTPHARRWNARRWEARHWTPDVGRLDT
jgi:hypothetical protein